MRRVRGFIEGRSFKRRREFPMITAHGTIGLPLAKQFFKEIGRE
jgi:hypothetical protein